MIMNTFLAYEPGKEPLNARYDKPFFRLMWRTTEQPLLKLIYVILIGCNVYLLSYFGYPVATEEAMDNTMMYHFLLTIFFFVEIVLKLLAYTMKEYFGSYLNLADMLCTFLFFVALVIDCSYAGQFTLQYCELYWTQRVVPFTALRALRFIIVLRTAHKSIKVLQDCMMYTIKQIHNFLILFCIFIYVFSLLGMQLFAGKLKFD
jgi:hypothetical protein